jgi:hypothetical protein
MKKIVGQKNSQDNQRLGRRRFLALSGAMGAMALPGIAAAETRELGLPPRPYGSRSPFERAVRYIPREQTRPTVSAIHLFKTSME